MSLKIITSEGSITLDDVKSFDEISEETIKFLEKAEETADLFFQDEIDLDDFKDSEDVEEELSGFIKLESDYDNPAKAYAISEYTDDSISDIEETSWDVNSFKTSNGEYLVLDEEEADEKSEEYAKTYFDGLDDETILKSLEHWGFDEEYIDTKWFDDAMQEYNYSYAYDIKSEGASEPYVNRLHEEMVEKGVLSEPEWPDEDDYTYEREEFEREDFDEEAPDAPVESDFDTEEEFDEAYEEYEQELSDWEDRQQEHDDAQYDAENDHDEEQNRLEEEAEEEYETAKSDYESELESDVEDNIDEFIEALNKDYDDDGLQYFRDHFGDSDVGRIIQEQGLADTEAMGLKVLDDEGRGYFLADYDHSEDEISISYKGEDYEFFIYRNG